MAALHGGSLLSCSAPVDLLRYEPDRYLGWICRQRGDGNIATMPIFPRRVHAGASLVLAVGVRLRRGRCWSGWWRGNRRYGGQRGRGRGGMPARPDAAAGERGPGGAGGRDFPRAHAPAVRAALDSVCPTEG